MKNQLVADLLYKIANILDLKGDIFFKTRAYRMAAQTIETMEEINEIFYEELYRRRKEKEKFRTLAESGTITIIDLEEEEGGPEDGRIGNGF